MDLGTQCCWSSNPAMPSSRSPGQCCKCYTPGRTSTQAVSAASASYDHAFLFCADLAEHQLRHGLRAALLLALQPRMVHQAGVERAAASAVHRAKHEVKPSVMLVPGSDLLLLFCAALAELRDGLRDALLLELQPGEAFRQESSVVLLRGKLQMTGQADSVPLQQLPGQPLQGHAAS